MKPSKSGLGACVSTMVNDECDLPDDQKTVFDWCKDGNINRVTSLLKNTDVNQKDAEVKFYFMILMYSFTCI